MTFDKCPELYNPNSNTTNTLRKFSCPYPVNSPLTLQKETTVLNYFFYHILGLSARTS